MFTKKHYEFIAETLRISRPSIQDQGINGQADLDRAIREWGAQVQIFAGRFELHFPRFDKSKFLAACGYQD